MAGSEKLIKLKIEIGEDDSKNPPEKIMKLHGLTCASPEASARRAPVVSLRHELRAECFSSFGGAKSAEAEDGRSSTVLRPWSSAKEDKGLPPGNPFGLPR